MKPLIPLTIALLVTLSSAAVAEPVGLLVTPKEIVNRLFAPPGDDGAVILDVRSEKEYQAGHIPRALHVNVGEWKSQGLADGGLTDESAWSDRVGKLGITRETSVIVYGGHPTSATRIWWTLKYVGVKHVGILDGGFAAWGDAGIRDVGQTKAVDFQPEFQKDRLADITEMQSLLKTKSATVIDTRSDAEYAGTGGPGKRHGHIPGAVHQEWTNFVTSDGHFKPVEEIKALLKQKGLTPKTKTVTHCQTGGRASLNAFAMELAGYGPVKNYYCGWSQWSTTKDSPIETP